MIERKEVSPPQSAPLCSNVRHLSVRRSSGLLDSNVGTTDCQHNIQKLCKRNVLFSTTHPSSSSIRNRTKTEETEHVSRSYHVLKKKQQFDIIPTSTDYCF